MELVNLIVIISGFLTVITYVTGLEEEAEGPQGIGPTGIGREFVYTYRTNSLEDEPPLATMVGYTFDVEDSSHCCEACNNQITNHTTNIFNFKRGIGRSNMTHCTCLENESGIQPATREVGIVTGTCKIPTDPCLEFDIHHIGNGLTIRDVSWGSNNVGSTRSAINCQAACQDIPECEWFNWNSIEDQCWLKSAKGNRTLYIPGGVSGPKTCLTGIDEGPIEVDGDLGDGRAFMKSELMEELYLGDLGLSSGWANRGEVDSRACCLECQIMFRETQMFQFYKHVGYCDCYKAPGTKHIPTYQREYFAGICDND